MCERCDSKMVAKRWVTWVSVIVVLTIFVLTQVFMYGEVVGAFNQHIKDDPTYRELKDEFVDKDEFNTMKEMILYLYKKEGGE